MLNLLRKEKRIDTINNYIKSFVLIFIHCKGMILIVRKNQGLHKLLFIFVYKQEICLTI